MRFAATLLMMMGCSQPDLTGLEVENARVTDLKFSSLNYYVGWIWTKGTLVVEDTSGGTHSYPVKLNGPMGGVDWGFSFGHEWESDRIPDTELYLPDGPVYGNQLLGEYGGATGGLSIGVGVEFSELINIHQVRIEDFDQTIGLEASASLQALYLRADGEDFELPNDTDFGGE